MAHAKMTLQTVAMAILQMAFSANGMSSFAGNCPKVDAVSFFNPNSFRGEWFEYGRYSPIFENISRCVKFTFSDPNHGVMELDLSGKSMQNFLTVTASGTAVNNNGFLSVKFPFLLPNPNDYLVLGTDYTSWAVLWTCQETVSGNVQNLIILTRQKSPYQFQIDNALRIIDSMNLSRFMLMPVDQSFC